MRSFRVPTLVLGGGGYTVRNVSRCFLFSDVLSKEWAERVAMLDVRDVDRAGEGGEERAAVHGLFGVLRTGLFAADHAEVGLVMMSDVQQHGEHERREVPERPRVHFAAAVGVVGGGARITD